MKSEQLQVVEAFVQGHDVFAILPTGYFSRLATALDGYLAKWLFLITVIMITSLHSCRTNRK